MPRAYEAPLGGAVPARTGRRRATRGTGASRRATRGCDQEAGPARRRGARREIDSREGDMEYRTLGRSGCAVSTYALGTMTFGKETDEAGSHAQLDAFVEAGGNLIDTADVYTARRVGGDHRPLAGRPARRRPRPGRARHQGPVPDGRRRRTTSACPAGTCSARSTPRCAGSASTASTSTRCTPGTRSPRSRRRCGFLDDAVRAGKIALRRAVQLHRLAGAEGRRPRRARAAWRRPVTLQPQYNLLVREIEWEIVPACLRRPASGCCPGRRSAAAG